MQDRNSPLDSRWLRQRGFGLLLLLLLGSGCSAGPTVILVRHAEKGEGKNPELTADGVARAKALAQALSRAGIDAIYSTQFRRTQATAEPVARALGLEVQTWRVDGNARIHATQFAGYLRRHHRGDTVLAVGHSNTVPFIVTALGAGELPQIPEDEYDHLYLVHLDGTKGARLVRARYGAAAATD